MKRVEINESDFKVLMDGVKHCVSKDNSRPILKYVQIKVKRDSITAYALDGYRAGRVQVKNDYSIEEEFTCLIKPLDVKVSKSEIHPVVIEQLDEKTFVEFITEYGILKYGFDIPNEEFFDIEKVYAAARPHDRELGVSPRFIIDAMKSLSQTNQIIGERHVVFESKESGIEAFIIKTENKGTTNEQLILPMRINILPMRINRGEQK